MDIMKKSKGFTLVEVLVTVVIMAIGLLGLAGLQVNALRNNLSAEQRAKAAQLVYDMSDRMRANVAGGTDYTSAAAEESNCVAIPVVGCTPTQLAKHDVFEWQNEINNALPGGQGDVSEAAGVFTITVNWDDNRDGVLNASDAFFTASFQPKQ